MAKIGNYVVGAEEDGTIVFNEQANCYDEVDNKERAIRYYNYIYEYCYGFKSDKNWMDWNENNIVACAVDVAHYNDCDVDIVTLNYNDWKESSNGQL